MQILRTLTFLAIAASTTSQDMVRPEVVAVTAVIDGGTIAAAGHGRVKLAGIKAPRVARGLSPDAAFGRAAKDRLEGIVIRRFVRLEFEPGGTRAYVKLEDGTCVNATLVREGLAAAEPAARTSHGSCAAEIVAAEQQARGMRRGIWSAREPIADKR